MIRRFDHLKTFGVFENFSWPTGLPEFKRYNLVFGWNYSGKTTLARALRCFELKRRHDDFASADVQIRMSDGATHQLSSPANAPAVRVFNSDFVRDNLIFDEASANPILVLGAADIAKQTVLKDKKEQRAKLTDTKAADEKTRSECKAAIEKALSSYARDFIKNPLSVPGYDKTRFEPKVVAYKDDPAKYILDDAALAQTLTVYRSADKKAALTPTTNSLTLLKALRDRAENLFAKTVTAARPIPRLVEDPSVEKWVEQGRHLHDGKTTCQFCGQVLPSNLLKELAAHFSAEYDALMCDLSTLSNDIANATKQAILLDHKASFYPEFADKFTDEKATLDKLLEQRITELDKIQKTISTKQTKAFTSVPCPDIDDPAIQIDSTIAAINKIVAEHNKRTFEFDSEKQKAFGTLEQHYAALFVRDQNYVQQLEKIDKLNMAIASAGRDVSTLTSEINVLERELSETVRGAERINDLLRAYFGKEDVRVDANADNQFQFVRGGAPARNLSEGEKTAIAFAYFITCLQDGREPLSSVIVLIDDPVSSLDANHLFNTYALIKTQLAGCKQLFILTHSFEFYGLVKEWMGEDEKTGYADKSQEKWRLWSAFLIRRTDTGTAVIEQIPKVLLKFKSEYHYLFSILYHFNRTGGENFESFLTLPNVVRRFMEAFGGIMIPLSTGLRGKLDRLFPDEVVRERVWKFMNDYSHNTTVIRSLTIPDTSECRAVVDACLAAVRSWDEAYFADLEFEVADVANAVGAGA